MTSMGRQKEKPEVRRGVGVKHTHGLFGLRELGSAQEEKWIHCINSAGCTDSHPDPSSVRPNHWPYPWTAPPPLPHRTWAPLSDPCARPAIESPEMAPRTHLRQPALSTTWSCARTCRCVAPKCARQTASEGGRETGIACAYRFEFCCSRF